jgi:hypothetical protein
MIDPVETAIASDEVRDVLAAAADVLFSDGISPALLDQWTAETCSLLRTRLMTERSADRAYDSPGNSKR